MTHGMKGRGGSLVQMSMKGRLMSCMNLVLAHKSSGLKENTCEIHASPQNILEKM